MRVVRKDLRIKVVANGDMKEFHGTRSFPASETDEILQLRPDPEHVNTERDIFERFTNEQTTPGTIARQMNIAGVEPPGCSPRWHHWHVADLLTNPVWVGLPSWNRRSVGKYSEYVGGERREMSPADGRKRKHDRSDWAMPEEPLFDPVVSPSTFAEAQRRLEALPMTRRSRPATYTYSGLVHCGRCGARMTGVKMHSGHGKRAKTTVWTYVCGTYTSWRGERSKCPCKRYSVRQERLDEEVRAYLREATPLLSDIMAIVRNEKPDELKGAIRRAVDAFRAMCDRVGAELVVEHSGEGKSYDMLWLPDDTFEYRRVLLSDAWSDTRYLEKWYRSVFADEAVNVETELENLHDEQDELIESIKKIPAAASRALAKVQRQLADVDERIAAAEEKLSNAADQFKHARREAERLQSEWEEAQRSLEDEIAGRRRAEAIRRVVGKIVVHFRDTGKKNPVGEVVGIDITPATDCGQRGTSPPATRSRPLS